MSYALKTDVNDPRVAHLHRSIRFWRFTALFSLGAGAAIIAALLWLLINV
jgi:hypothetical protein